MEKANNLHRKHAVKDTIIYIEAEIDLDSVPSTEVVVH